MAGKEKVECSKCGGFYNSSQILRHEKSCKGLDLRKPKLVKCPFCGINLIGRSASEKANHVRWCKLNPKAVSYRENMSCISKNIDYKKVGLSLKKAHKEGKYDECNKRKIGKKCKPHTKETRKLLSDIRKEYLKNNPEKHPWKTCNKLKSKPCEIIKDYFRERGLIFEEEYTALKERSFALDLAFIDLKIAIEVNGNQHYNRDGTLKEYYQDRHNLLNLNGWIILEIYYNVAFDTERLNELYILVNQIIS